MNQSKRCENLEFPHPSWPKRTASTMMKNMVSVLLQNRCGSVEWHWYLNIICVPLFFTFGLCGNTLSFIVLGRRVYKHKSYSYYLRGVAITDSVTLVIVAVRTAHDVKTQLSGEPSFLVYHSELSCKISEFFSHSVLVMSSWFIVLFTLDR